jgi:hypothetical protein
LVCIALTGAAFLISHQHQEANRESVLRWLNERPFSWSQDLGYPPPPQLPYATWIDQGNAIPHAREILTNLLERRERRVDLAQVALTLGELGDRRCCRVLVASLSSNDRDERMAAAISLGALKCDEAVPALGRLAVYDPDENVRLNAVGALEELPPSQTRPFLIQATHDSDTVVAKFASQILDRENR